ncbi:hypothetical protein YC2023_024291 [Brassica napus]
MSAVSEMTDLLILERSTTWECMAYSEHYYLTGFWLTETDSKPNSTTYGYGLDAIETWLIQSSSFQCFSHSGRLFLQSLRPTTLRLPLSNDLRREEPGLSRDTCQTVVKLFDEVASPGVRQHIFI